MRGAVSGVAGRAAGVSRPGVAGAARPARPGGVVGDRLDRRPFRSRWWPPTAWCCPISARRFGARLPTAVDGHDRPAGAVGGRHRDRRRPRTGAAAMTASRRSQRRASAFLLYQRDLTGSEFEALYDAYRRDNGDAVTDFIRAHVEGAWGDRDRLDRSIDAAADTWSTERMAVLERNILRLAVWELSTGGGSRGGRHRRGGGARQAVRVARGRGARQRGAGAGSRANRGWGHERRHHRGAATDLQRARSARTSGWRLEGSRPPTRPSCSSRSPRWPRRPPAAIERRAETLDD